MFKKIFEYAGPHKKGIYTATAVMLLSVLMGVLPFVLAYQIIAPLVMGNPIGTAYVTMRLVGILVCLVLQAVLNGWGLDISHRAAYNTLSACVLHCKSVLKRCPWVSFKTKELAQSKSCLLMMLTAWSC